MDLGLNNQTALVTGSYRGTGQIIAATLADEGARVLIHGFTAEQARSAVTEIGGGTPVWGDISKVEGSAELAGQLAGHDIDILINNYGTADRGNWTDSSSSDWITAYEKNVLSAQRTIQTCLPSMLTRNRGRIVNLGTIGSTRPNKRMPGYYAAKGALANMTVSLAKEVAGTGVRVNLVSPGLILTPEVKASYLESGRRNGWGETWEEVYPQLKKEIAKDIPIGRITSREEVAALVAYLCSTWADAIHGQNIRIDGGVTDIVS